MITWLATSNFWRGFIGWWARQKMFAAFWKPHQDFKHHLYTVLAISISTPIFLPTPTIATYSGSQTKLPRCITFTNSTLDDALARRPARRHVASTREWWKDLDGSWLADDGLLYICCNAPQITLSKPAVDRWLSTLQAHWRIVEFQKGGRFSSSWLFLPVSWLIISHNCSRGVAQRPPNYIRDHEAVGPIGPIDVKTLKLK